MMRLMRSFHARHPFASHPPSAMRRSASVRIPPNNPKVCTE